MFLNLNGLSTCLLSFLTRFLISVSPYTPTQSILQKNYKIIGNSQNWVELCFLESLHIKWKKPKVNCGIKSIKELVLFS